MYSRRCPGATCITSIKSGKTGNIGNPCNDSKGCGGVMRVAPAGIALAKMLKPKRIAVIGAKIAAITHGHALGYIPAAAMTHMIAALYLGAEIKEAIFDAVRCTSELFSQTPHVDDFDGPTNRDVHFKKAHNVHFAGNRQTLRRARPRHGNPRNEDGRNPARTGRKGKAHRRVPDEVAFRLIFFPAEF